MVLLLLLLHVRYVVQVRSDSLGRVGVGDKRAGATQYKGEAQRYMKVAGGELNNLRRQTGFV